MVLQPSRIFCMYVCSFLCTFLIVEYGTCINIGIWKMIKYINKCLSTVLVLSFISPSVPVILYCI